MSYLFHGAVAVSPACKCISKHLANSDCCSSRAAQNVSQIISLVKQPSLFWVLLEFLVFHSTTSHHILPILLFESKRCGEHKERKFILYLVWTIHCLLLMDVNSFWLFWHYPLIRQFQHSETWANHSSRVHINPSMAGHAIFSFHISVSSQFLEASRRKDTTERVKPFWPVVLCCASCMFVIRIIWKR